MTQPSANAIVVLGCALHTGRPSPALTRRVACGVALFERGVAPLLVLSGGGPAGQSEAAAMREMALARGVPAKFILLESNSRNTVENAFETATVMRARGLASVVLVSDFYHLARARWLFRLAGLVVVATDHPPCRFRLRELPLYLREAPALVASALRVAGRSRSSHTGQ
jgi:uncharacterized SAM-binding protein YcdF (DUF218 family)